MALTTITPAPPKVDDFWALARSAVYLKGKGITYGPPLLQASAINSQVYSISLGLAKTQGMAAVDSNLDIFAEGSLDHVLVTPMIAAHAAPGELLKEATQKLKMGGHLVLLTEVNRERPGHTTFDPARVREMVERLHHWQLKADHIENGKHLIIVKKVPGKRGIEPCPRGSGKKRVCIARYGALGDAIIMTPLIHQLSEDGYEVTLNISSYCAPIFENNPYIDNILIQERDLIPNPHLGRYWALWEQEYDRYINLSESIEGDLLLVEGRPPFFSSKEWRHEKCDKNYYDYTMERGGYPEVVGKRGELYFTAGEERRTEKFFAPLSKTFTIVWALNGSSYHKVYPMMEPLLRDWLGSHADARCITTGDANARHSEFFHPQLIHRAGEWSIRESLLATKYASCVVGPETMMTNAASCFPTPKITLLSHSSHENLCKHWEGDFCLAPDAACYPCHQLHYSRESCPMGTMEDTATGEVLGEAPLCTMAIAPERVMAQLDRIYAAWASKRHGASA